MSKLDKDNNLLIIILLTLSFLILAYVMYQSTSQPTTQNTSLFETSKLPDLAPNPTSTPISKPKNSSMSQPSPEGAMMLTIKTKENSDGKTAYTIFVKSKDLVETEIYKDTLNTGSSVDIPFNTWSPNNQHFFIKVSGKNKDNYLVFKASGEKFDEFDYINATDKYVEDEIPYNLGQITGWAAPYLLIAQTTKPENNEEGPSYWFEIPSQKYIQLYTRF